MFRPSDLVWSEMFWVWDRQGSNVRAWFKLWDKCGSTVKQKESEQAYPHSCVCPLRGQNRDCRHTHTSPVCSRKSRRAGRDFCLRHIRLCLKGKSHMLLWVFVSIQTPSELQTNRFFLSKVRKHLVTDIFVWTFLIIRKCSVHSMGTTFTHNSMPHLVWDVQITPVCNDAK